jgi:hypothetical protein
MRAGVKEVAEMLSCIRQHIRIGNADAVETKRARFAIESGLQIGRRERGICVQKSRST